MATSCDVGQKWLAFAISLQARGTRCTIVYTRVLFCRDSFYSHSLCYKPDRNRPGHQKQMSLLCSRQRRLLLRALLFTIHNPFQKVAARSASQLTCHEYQTACKTYCRQACCSLYTSVQLAPRRLLGAFDLWSALKIAFLYCLDKDSLDFFCRFAAVYYNAFKIYWP